MNTLFEKMAGKDEWLTPPEIIRSLGSFDLDPCSPINRPWDTAKHHYTINDDGLRTGWFGRVWCNPPYGKELIHWLKRCSEHKNCIALVFARTDTKAFQRYVFPCCEAVLFLAGRIRFYDVKGTQCGTAGAPSVLIAYDLANAIILKEAGLCGQHINIRQGRLFEPV